MRPSSDTRELEYDEEPVQLDSRGPEGLAADRRSDPSSSSGRGGAAAGLKPVEFARWIWRQLTSMRTALILLFLLAVAAIPGSVIPQERVDPSAVVLWKDKHPSLTPAYERLGMFNVFSSVWFSAIYLLLMLSLVGCIIPRLRVYARAVRQRPPRAPRNLSRLAAYDTWSTDEQPAEVGERARALFVTQRRRVDVVATDVDAEIVVNAEKGYLREAGNLLFHCALVVVLVGVAVTGLFGFKGSAAIVTGQGFSNTLIQYDEFTPGARFDAADLTPFSFTVEDFDVEWERDGAGTGTPLTFDADLSVTAEPGSEPYGYDLRVNHPLEVGGTSVYLVGHGYAPRVTVRDGDGDVAFSGPVVFLPQDGSFVSFGVIKAPDAAPTQLGFEGYFFPTAALGDQGQPYSAFPDADNPVLSLIAYTGDLGVDDGQPQSVYVLDKSAMQQLQTPGGNPRALLLRDGDTVQLGHGRGSISFDGYQRWVKLQINRSPGKIVPLVGVLTAIVGLLGSLFVRPRRTWVRVRRDGGRSVVEVAALDRVSGGDPIAHIDEVVTALRPPATVPGRGLDPQQEEPR
ncbi:MAG: cytochrome c biogenesis protein ResB [Propionibacteriales bacterium]|nr:cytochrome c biogenesis protein ResB [Propionibacteriales bacterium]